VRGERGTVLSAIE